MKHKVYCLQKIKVKITKGWSAAVLLGTLRAKVPKMKIVESTSSVDS